jgi:hypothetical protein
MILPSFQDAVSPGSNVVIDESMISWRGRLFLNQYIPGRSNKYGVKLNKLCLPGGYTHGFEVFAGKKIKI